MLAAKSDFILVITILYRCNILEKKAGRKVENGGPSPPFTVCNEFLELRVSPEVTADPAVKKTPHT